MLSGVAAIPVHAGGASRTGSAPCTNLAGCPRRPLGSDCAGRTGWTGRSCLAGTGADENGNNDEPQAANTLDYAHQHLCSLTREASEGTNAL
ncbi:MAG: hypothetical protein BGO98_02795 [Myxococcales bacterium 68-20]|nr:MAG: hypothetical protein BGO98_02795 [Myxococcales bacterium 68-20]